MDTHNLPDLEYTSLNKSCFEKFRSETPCPEPADSGICIRATHDRLHLELPTNFSALTAARTLLEVGFDCSLNFVTIAFLKGTTHSYTTQVPVSATGQLTALQNRKRSLIYLKSLPGSSTNPKMTIQGTALNRDETRLRKDQLKTLHSHPFADDTINH